MLGPASGPMRVEAAELDALVMFCGRMRSLNSSAIRAILTACNHRVKDQELHRQSDQPFVCVSSRAICIRARANGCVEFLVPDPR